mgnify:CR=1 FL=1
MGLDEYDRGTSIIRANLHVSDRLTNKPILNFWSTEQTSMLVAVIYSCAFPNVCDRSI